MNVHIKESRMKGHRVLVMLLVTVAFTVLLAGTAPAVSIVLLADNFDTENGGVGVLNYTGFANWDVSNGNVDLIGSTGFFNFLPGNGLYVDMDGTTPNDAGKMTSKTAFALNPGSSITYELSFELAGNQRNSAAESVMVQLGTAFSETFSLPQNAPFTLFTRSITVASATNANLSFEGIGGDDIGMLLDDVRLVEVVPEPMSLLLLGSGLAGLGLWRWRLLRKGRLQNV